MSNSNYVFPEKWYIQWENKEHFKIIQGYLEVVNKRGWVFTKPHIHSHCHVNYRNDYANSNPLKKINFKDCTLITFSQFEQYVLGKTPAKKESDNMNQLIKLLNSIKNG